MVTTRNLPDYTDGYWESDDGLRLHYRDYPGREDRPPLLCIPGLTRNARDFEQLAQRASGEWRVIVVELRGRGESAYAKDPMTYAPLNYLKDLQLLVEHLGVERLVAVGTSLGGILTMLLATSKPGLVVGAVLNDVGPVLDPAGINRIRGAVGKANWHKTWMHAARALSESSGPIYPDYTITDWLDMAKRLYKLTSTGRIVLDYDMKIAEPLRLAGGEAGGDLWGAFAALKPVPLLVLRGGTSDILPHDVAQRMVDEAADGELVTLDNIGHAPTLNEPQSVTAIDRLLARVLKKGSNA